MSALCRGWMSAVTGSGPVLITAEGLLMYLQPSDALALIASCAAHFPGGQMVFDSVPRRYSDKTLRGLSLSRNYSLPPMPFSFLATQAAQLPRSIPNARSPFAPSLSRPAVGGGAPTASTR